MCGTIGDGYIHGNVRILDGSFHDAKHFEFGFQRQTVTSFAFDQCRPRRQHPQQIFFKIPKQFFFSGLMDMSNCEMNSSTRFMYV